MRYAQVTWREGSNAALCSRFACLRVRAAHRTHLRDSLRAEEWLLVEWPEGDAEPAKYWLSTAPADATLEQLMYVDKMRWRIERDYEDLRLLIASAIARILLRCPCCGRGNSRGNL